MSSRKRNNTVSRNNVIKYTLAFLLVLTIVGTYMSLLLRVTTTTTTTTTKSTHVRTSIHTAAAAAIQTQQDTLVLSLHNIGDIRIALRPDWSKESIDYLHRIVGHCQRCQFYRSEKPGILQGVMAAPDIAVASKKGVCPAGAEAVHNDCPPWDAECGCHGPVMRRGYVAWAAGKTGPDFFINAYHPKPAVWWGTQHTVWGEIQDAASLKLIDEYIFSLPTHKQGGLKMLNEPIPFDLSWQ